MDYTLQAPEAYLVIDTETTGLSASDRIIELAAVKVVHGEIVDQRSQLIQPEVPLPPFITGLTGITPDMLRGKKTIREVLPRFLDFAGDLPIIGHNISFDLGMIHQEAKRVGIPVRLTPGADTLMMSRQRLPHVRSHSLTNLVDELHISYRNNHRALADVYATQQLYELLLAMPTKHRP